MIMTRIIVSELKLVGNKENGDRLVIIAPLNP
jgi:hypothetical protein